MEYLKPSQAGKETVKFIKNLIYKDILMNEGSPDIVLISNKVVEFEEKIKQSVLNGEPDYLKSANIKTEDAYSDSMAVGSYKAAFVWNSLFPDNQIELPGVAYLIPVKLQKPKDFAQLSVTDSVLFERLMNLFNENDRIKKTGITQLAIPLDERVPKSLEPYIDLNNIICKNLGLLLPTLNCIGFKTTNRTKSNAFFTNIIDL